MANNQSLVEMNEEEDNEMDFVILVITTVCVAAEARYNDERRRVPNIMPLPDCDLLRRSFVNSLYNGSEVDCLEQLRISKQTFMNLCKLLQEKGQLVRTKHVPVEEAIAMFLYILAHNLKYRVIHKYFFRSIETVSRQFNKVLQAIMKVSKEYLRRHRCAPKETEAEKWKWFEVIS